MKGDQLQNFPIPVADIDGSDSIYVPQVAILKLNSIRKRPGQVANIPRFPIPLPIEN